MRYSISQQHFERMKPGLLLASYFVEKATTFLAKIMFAEPDSTMDGHCLDTTFEPDTQHLANMDLTLIEVSKILRIFRSSSKEEDQISLATCVNLAARFLDVEQPEIHCSKERPPLAIVLNADLFDFWLKPESVWKGTHEHTKQMYSFELAVTLVHEMAHAVWILRKLRSQGLLVKSPDLAVIHGEERPSEFQTSQKELLDALRELRKKWSYFDRVRQR